MSGFDLRLTATRRSSAGEVFRLQAELQTTSGLTVVCGPSGSGKSTLLLALLGALRPDTGHIRLGPTALFDSSRGIDLPLRERRVGMVFQDALLFPHLDVRGNVSFGMRGADRERRSRELLERAGAGELMRRRPGELSGGQRQRVALARALASDPLALLLDEPFSALDAPARESLGRLLLELRDEAGIPFLHVTHDLAEALRLGDRLALLDAGSIVQVGAPAEVLARPASVAAARAVGAENLLSGTVRRHLPDSGCSEVEVDGTLLFTGLLQEAPGERVALGLRAEDILISLREIRETSARNVLPGTIEQLTEKGAAVELRVVTPASLRVVVTPVSVRELNLRPGARVYLLIKAAAIHRLV